MASQTTLNILRNVRALVGEVAFTAAVEALKSEPIGVADIAVKAGKKEKKEKKPRNTDPVKTEKRKADMTALQAFIAKVRSEMPDGTPYKEVQAAAGTQWKALSEDEKNAWKAAHPYVPSATSSPAESEAEAEAEAAPEEKTVTVVVPEPTAAKKPRGRPSKKVVVKEEAEEKTDEE
jgi:hypothetical protein